MPLCRITVDRPPYVIDPLRGYRPVFGATVKFKNPDPIPDFVLLVMVIHDAVVAAVHEQYPGRVNPNESEPPSASNSMIPGP